jgi:hypothetical protein
MRSEQIGPAMRAAVLALVTRMGLVDKKKDAKHLTIFAQ